MAPLLAKERFQKNNCSHHTSLQFFILTLALLCACGCAASNSQKLIYEKEKYQYDVMSVPDVTKQEVLSTPRTFVLDYYENTYAWERAKIFFKEHTTSFLGERKISAEKTLLSNIESSKDRYAFEVERSKIPEGFKYQINCFMNELSGEDRSDLNARNLARFIQKGQLERSLLN